MSDHGGSGSSDQCGSGASDPVGSGASVPSPVFSSVTPDQVVSDPLSDRRSRDVRSGRTDFPSGRRSVSLDFSQISEMDGYLHAITRLRLERDICAQVLSESVCDVFGLASFESAGSF